MRAVVDNRELGALNGVDPNRVSSVAWVLGSMLAALAGVLIAPILPQFTPVALTLLVISAYAAAMVGRLRSLPLTFLGAVILGELEYLLAFIDTKRIGGDTVADLAKDLQASAPVILLFLVLILLPEDRVGRRGRRAGTGPPSRRCGRWRLAMVAYLAVVLRDRAVRMGVRVDHRRARQGHRARCRHAVARAAHRVRRADLAGPARLRRHRRGHGVEARARRRPGRRGGDRGRGRRARGPARAEDARPLPGPRHDGLRPVHRGEPLRRQPVVPADAAVLARQRDRRPVPRVARTTPRSSWPWPSCSRSWSCCSP